MGCGKVIMQLLCSVSCVLCCIKRGTVGKKKSHIAGVKRLVEILPR